MNRAKAFDRSQLLTAVSFEEKKRGVVKTLILE